MDSFDNTLHVVTSGGWLAIDPQTGETRKFTNTDGLGTGDLYDIVRDDDGIIWIAGRGRLIRYHENEIDSYLFFGRNDELMTLYSLADDGDQIWVGTSEGLVLFSKMVDDGQIEDIFFRFGSLNPEPIVRDILLVGDSIWLATSNGLAVADKSNPTLLKSYVNWTSLKPSVIYGAVFDSVTALTRFQGDIYLGTATDLLRLDITPTDTSFFDIPALGDVNVAGIYVEGDSLVAYADGGYFIYYNENVVKYTPPELSLIHI